MRALVMLTTTLLVLTLGAPLLAGEKTDAAVKELRAELEAVETIMKQVAEPKPAKPLRNGWAEFKAWCDAAHAIKADYDAGWYVALTDLESVDHPPPSSEAIGDALARTAKLPGFMEKAAPFDEIAGPASAEGAFEALEVLPIIDAFKYGVGRAVLLARTGRGSEGRAELRVLAEVLGKLRSTQSNLSLMLYDSLRSLVINSGLLQQAGSAGWDAAFIREIVALMPAPSTRPSVLLLGELRSMAAKIRSMYLKEGDVLEAIKKGDKTRMSKAADADAEGAKILSEIGAIVKVMRLLIAQDRVEPIDTGTLAGMKKALEFAEGLGQHQFLIWQPCLAALRRGVLEAALKLRLLEWEKGALIQHKAAAEKLVAAHIGVKLTWEGDTAVLALDEQHEIVAKRVYAPEIRLKPAKR